PAPRSRTRTPGPSLPASAPQDGPTRTHTISSPTSTATPSRPLPRATSPTPGAKIPRPARRPRSSTRSGHVTCSVLSTPCSRTLSAPPCSSSTCTTPPGCREDKAPRSSPGPHPARPPRGRWLRPLLGGREPADREGAGALADRSRLRGEGPPQLEHGPVGGGHAP